MGGLGGFVRRPGGHGQPGHGYGRRRTGIDWRAGYDADDQRDARLSRAQPTNPFRSSPPSRAMDQRRRCPRPVLTNRPTRPRRVRRWRTPTPRRMTGTRRTRLASARSRMEPAWSGCSTSCAMAQSAPRSGRRRLSSTASSSCRRPAPPSSSTRTSVEGACPAHTSATRFSIGAGGRSHTSYCQIIIPAGAHCPE